jgi:8-amino-7-oxononanoate synthase
VDIFEKCRQFYANADFAQHLGYPASPRLAQALGLYPYFVPIERSEGPEVTVDGKRLIMIGSNNYLGLTMDARVREAAVEAIRTYGTSCTGSRFLNGTLQMHEELEERLATFVGKEKALVFAAGYQTNLGAIAALAGREDILIADKESHASILDGMGMARGTRGAQMRYFRHKDMGSLESILQSYPEERGKLVIVDGVFSMGGDIAPLPEIIRLCHRYSARLMVDEAHALGVLGGGRGTSFHHRCVEGVDLIMGTFSKSFASNGGFVAGSKDVIHWIQHFARSFMFSASLPPANVATVLAGLSIIQEEPDRIRRVNEISRQMRQHMRGMDYDIGSSETPIIPIVIGDQYRALQAWHTLFKLGVYANVALPPAVSSQRSLVRTSYMALHTDEHLERVLTAFKLARNKLLRPTVRITCGIGTSPGTP